ncbi:MAG TPA: NADH-quinone oxidoreductase subunit H [Bacteroidales bacterium]|nr:NADH-quinone oxidoreductase subunit H [Bacteroidales bacterium]
MVALILILTTSLFFPGLIVRVKSIASGRKGPGILQPIKNIYVLLRKGIVYSTLSGTVSRFAPVIVFGSVAVASLMIPVAGFEPLISFNGDFILFAYLLALARFMMIIASFDTGSSFEGMDASREALYGMLIEPALFILLAGLVVFTGEYSLTSIFNLPGGENYNLIYGLIISYILGNITIIENSRVPLDDPKTHLELTMIHEVMVLDTSGFNLALIQFSSFIKFAVFGSLIASALIPRDLSLAWRLISFVTVQMVFAATIGFLESFRTRFKMNRNQQFILTVTMISVLMFVIILFTKNIF